MLGPSAHGFSMPVKLNASVFAILEVVIHIDLGVVIVCRYCIFYLTWENSLTGFGRRLVRGHSHGTCASVETNCAAMRVSCFAILSHCCHQSVCRQLLLALQIL